MEQGSRGYVEETSTAPEWPQGHSRLRRLVTDMTAMAESAAQARRLQWRVIASLNAVSALAQVGQFGIAFVLYPLALQAHGVAAWQIGAVSGALWTGNLLGLVLAPRVIAVIGYQNTVRAGLFVSAVALLVTPSLATAWWSVSAVLSGFGMGLRWIGNETWLFGVVPNEAQGRAVGFHEALLGIAAVAGPALIALLGATGGAPFIAAAFFSAAAAIPLWLAGGHSQPMIALQSSQRWTWQRLKRGMRAYLTLGALIAGLGGLIEGGFVGLFPVYASGHGLDVTHTAWLLTVFGVGAMVLQFPLGWLADWCGVRATAIVTALATALCAFAIHIWSPVGISMAAMMFLIGGAITGFLTLGLIAATSVTDAGVLAEELSRVSIAFTALSAVGPLAAGATATVAGSDSLMPLIAVAAVVLGLTVWALRGSDR